MTHMASSRETTIGLTNRTRKRLKAAKTAQTYDEYITQLLDENGVPNETAEE